MFSATTTIGLVLLWDVDGGLTQIDKHLYSLEEWIKSEDLLACGIVNTGVIALATGVVSVGSCNGEVTSTILQTLMEKTEADTKDCYAKYLPLDIGICYLGK